MIEKTEIQLSKNKLFLGIGGSILFVGTGIWLISNTNGFQNNSIELLRNPLLIKGIGILSILFFGATGIFGFRKLFDKKAGLIIDSNGITDNSNGTSIGLIEWKDICDIKTLNIMSTKFLLIIVNNPEDYIEKAKNSIKSKLMKANMKMYGTPLSITSNTLKYDFDDLEELLISEFGKSKM